MLSSEFQILENPLKEDTADDENENEIDNKTVTEEIVENVTGVFLLNQHLIVHGTGTWVVFNMRAEKLETNKSPMNMQEWPLLSKFH